LFLGRNLGTNTSYAGSQNVNRHRNSVEVDYNRLTEKIDRSI